MKSFSRIKMLVLAAVFLPCVTIQAHPGFSRQMDMDCMSCHNQTLSQLNAFGRKFAASGMTMTSGTGAQSLIDGETMRLGLPSVLNASVLLKARYTKFEPEISKQYEDVGTERGNLEMFKGSKVFLGGRFAENVGGFMHFMYDSFGAKFAFTEELGSGYGGIALFMEEDFGPFAGMEYYNTGLYTPLKLFANRKGTNAAQATELGHGPATGAQAYYGGDTLYLMAGAYLPATSQHEGLDSGSSAIGIARIAVAPTFGEWTFMIGAYGLSGTATMSDQALDDTKPEGSTAKLIDITRKAYGFDMQIEGNIAGMSTVIVLQDVIRNETELYNATDNIPLFELISANSGQDFEAGDNKAFSVEVQVNPLDALGVKVAYLHYNDRYDYLLDAAPEGPKKVDKWDRDDYTVGLDYSYRQNIRFVFEYTYSDVVDNDRTASSLSDSDNFLLSATIGF